MCVCVSVHLFIVCVRVVRVSIQDRVAVHGCAFASQFMRICDFLRYICSKVSIWCAGLDLVASNKLLFQCCLCSGLHHRQLCGWPPRATTRGAIHLTGMSHCPLTTALRRTGRSSGALSRHTSKQL